MSKKIGLDVCLAVCFAIAPLSATPIVFSYTSDNLGSGTTADSIVKSDISGLSVTATAWGLTGNSATTFQTAALGQYSGLGLGVCDAFELGAAGGCQSPQHEIDNNGRFDFVLFQFSSPVNSVTIKIDPVCICDTDVSYFVGNGLSPSGETLAQMGTVIDSLGSSATRTVILTRVSAGVTSILFGASTSSSN